MNLKQKLFATLIFTGIFVSIIIVGLEYFELGINKYSILGISILSGSLIGIIINKKFD